MKQVRTRDHLLKLILDRTYLGSVGLMPCLGNLPCLDLGLNIRTGHMTALPNLLLTDGTGPSYERMIVLATRIYDNLGMYGFNLIVYMPAWTGLGYLAIIGTAIYNCLHIQPWTLYGQDYGGTQQTKQGFAERLPSRVNTLFSQAYCCLWPSINCRQDNTLLASPNNM